MTFTTRPELRGTVGMVSSTHWLASAAGLARLEAGGTAFDAQIAETTAAGGRAVPHRVALVGGALPGAPGAGRRPGPGAGSATRRGARHSRGSSARRNRRPPTVRARSIRPRPLPRHRRLRADVVESRFGPEIVVRLRSRGHEVVVSAAWSLGRLCAVGRDPDGRLGGAANARGMQGYAVGR